MGIIMDKEKDKSTAASLEENFAGLEMVMEQLEAEDIALETAFSVYSRGMQLIKACNSQIDKVEKKVLKLTQEGGLEELI